MVAYNTGYSVSVTDGRIITDDGLDVRAKDCGHFPLDSVVEGCVDGKGLADGAVAVPAAASVSSKGRRFTRKMLTKEMQRRYWYLLESGQTDAEEFEVLHDFFSNPVDEDTDDGGNWL